eukprot:768548-Hanusia_phi.AAC.7
MVTCKSSIILHTISSIHSVHLGCLVWLVQRATFSSTDKFCFSHQQRSLHLNSAFQQFKVQPRAVAIQFTCIQKRTFSSAQNDSKEIGCPMEVAKAQPRAYYEMTNEQLLIFTSKVDPTDRALTWSMTLSAGRFRCMQREIAPRDHGCRQSDCARLLSRGLTSPRFLGTMHTSACSRSKSRTHADLACSHCLTSQVGTPHDVSTLTVLMGRYRCQHCSRVDLCADGIRPQHGLVMEGETTLQDIPTGDQFPLLPQFSNRVAVQRECSFRVLHGRRLQGLLGRLFVLPLRR